MCECAVGISITQCAPREGCAIGLCTSLALIRTDLLTKKYLYRKIKSYKTHKTLCD